MIDADFENAGLEPLGEGRKIMKAKVIEWTTNRMTYISESSEER